MMPALDTSNSGDLVDQPAVVSDFADDQERVSAEELAAFKLHLSQLESVHSGGLDDARDGLRPGRIGRFLIQESLGSGSFGTVYVAYDPRMSRNVAIKVAHFATAADTFKRKRFLAEAEAAARLGHPNVVTVHESGEEAGFQYIVYQLCVGPTLDDWMSGQPDRIEPNVAVEIVRQLAQGLSHAHAHGIVHRDVKPGNVVLQEADDPARLAQSCPISFIPRLTDFGLAHIHHAVEKIAEEDSFLGTIDFMSPEQVQGFKASQFATSDIYSLGVLLYRLLTGVLPSAGTDTLDVLHNICSVEPASPRYLCSYIPQDLAAICLKCLAKQPRDRYTSCEALIDDLDNWRSGDAVAARPRSALESVLNGVFKAPLVSALALAMVITCGVSGSSLAYMVAQLRKSNRDLLGMLDTTEASRQIAAEALVAKDAALRQLENQRDAVYHQYLQKLDACYRADMHLAYADFNAGRVVAAGRALDSIEHALGGHRKPGFEFYLLRACLVRTSRNLSGHSQTANDSLSLPNTNLVASCGDDGFILFHDLQSSEVLYRFSAGDRWQPTALAISPQGDRLAVGWSVNLPFGKASAVVTTYNFDSSQANAWIGSKICQLWMKTTVESLCFSPDGQRLAMGPRYNEVVVHDFESDEKLSIKTQSRNRSLEFSSDGSRLLVLQAAAGATIVDAHSGRHISHLVPDRDLQVARWSPDEKWVAFTERNSQDICLVDVEHPRQIAARFEQSNSVIETFCFDPSSLRLVGGTRAGSIVVWSLQQLDRGVQPAAVQETTPHSGIIKTVHIVAGHQTDGELVVSVDDQGEVIATPLLPATHGQPNADHEHPLAIRLMQDADSTLRQTVDRSGSTSALLVGYADGSLKQVEHNGQLVRTLLQDGVSEISAIATSADGRWAAAGLENGRVLLVDLVNNQAVRECVYGIPMDSTDERRINSIQFSADGRHLAACGDDARLRVWRVADCSQPIIEKTHTSLAYSVCFVGKKSVACGGMFEEIHIYDVATGNLQTKLTGTSRARALLFDTARNLLVSGHGDGRIRIHDASQWRLENSLVDTVEPITSLCLSPCRGCYLAGNEGGGVSIWDAEAQSFIGNLPFDRRQSPIASMEIGNSKYLFLLTRPGTRPEINRIPLTTQVAHN